MDFEVTDEYLEKLNTLTTISVFGYKNLSPEDIDRILMEIEDEIRHLQYVNSTAQKREEMLDEFQRSAYSDHQRDRSGHETNDRGNHTMRTNIN